MQLRLQTVPAETLSAEKVMTIFRELTIVLIFFITGLYVYIALAFLLCCCIVLAVLSVHLYRKLRNKDKGKGPKKDYLKRRSSIPDCYTDNYYDSIDQSTYYTNLKK